MSIDPANLCGALTLYWNRRAETYLVQPMRRLGRLGLEDAGDGRVINASNGGALPQIILEELDHFESREAEASPNPSKSQREQEARFFREHDAVIVTKLLDGRLEFTPCEHFRGGYKAMSAATITVMPPVEASAVLAVVEEAFARARA